MFEGGVEALFFWPRTRCCLLQLAHSALPFLGDFSKQSEVTYFLFHFSVREMSIIFVALDKRDSQSLLPSVGMFWPSLFAVELDHRWIISVHFAPLEWLFFSGRNFAVRTSHFIRYSMAVTTNEFIRSRSHDSMKSRGTSNRKKFQETGRVTQYEIVYMSCQFNRLRSARSPTSLADLVYFTPWNTW